MKSNGHPSRTGCGELRPRTPPGTLALHKIWSTLATGRTKNPKTKVSKFGSLLNGGRHLVLSGFVLQGLVHSTVQHHIIIIIQGCPVVLLRNACQILLQFSPNGPICRTSWSFRTPFLDPVRGPPGTEGSKGWICSVGTTLGAETTAASVDASSEERHPNPWSPAEVSGGEGSTKPAPRPVPTPGPLGDPKAAAQRKRFLHFSRKCLVSPQKRPAT